MGNSRGYRTRQPVTSKWGGVARAVGNGIMQMGQINYREKLQRERDANLERIRLENREYNDGKSKENREYNAGIRKEDLDRTAKQRTEDQAAINTHQGIMQAQGQQRIDDAQENLKLTRQDTINAQQLNQLNSYDVIASKMQGKIDSLTLKIKEDGDLDGNLVTEVAQYRDKMNDAIYSGKRLESQSEYLRSISMQRDPDKEGADVKKKVVATDQVEDGADVKKKVVATDQVEDDLAKPTHSAIDIAYARGLPVKSLVKKKKDNTGSNKTTDKSKTLTLVAKIRAKRNEESDVTGFLKEYTVDGLKGIWKGIDYILSGKWIEEANKNYGNGIMESNKRDKINNMKYLRKKFTTNAIKILEDAIIKADNERNPSKVEQLTIKYTRLTERLDLINKYRYQ